MLCYYTICAGQACTNLVNLFQSVRTVRLVDIRDDLSWLCMCCVVFCSQQAEVSSLDEQRIGLQERVYRLERQVTLLGKERDSLKALLASYAKEVRS